jgi:virulence-associated protein VapD
MEKKPTLEEAQKVLMEEQQKKLKECIDEITPILEKHGFGLQQTMPQIILIKK